MPHYNEVVIDTPGPYLGFLQSRMPHDKLLRIDFLPQCTTKIPGLTDRHKFPEKVYCLFTVMINPSENSLEFQCRVCVFDSMTYF